MSKGQRGTSPYFHYIEAPQLSRPLPGRSGQIEPGVARVYINEGLAILVELQLRTNSRAKAYRRQYEHSKSLDLQTLEHALKGRNGGITARSQRSRISFRIETAGGIKKRQREKGVVWTFPGAAGPRTTPWACLTQTSEWRGSVGAPGPRGP